MKFEDIYPIAVSVQGSDHIAWEKEDGREYPCQDKSYSNYITSNSTFSTSFFISSVCDGHGSPSSFRSGTGAEFGIKAFLQTIKKNIDDISNENIISKLREITESTCEIWLKLVKDDFANNPITDFEREHLNNSIQFKKYLLEYDNGLCLERIYGCTALAFVYIPSKKIWFALQLGDGDIIFKKKGKQYLERVFKQSVDEYVGEATDSLCSINAVEKFKIEFGMDEEIENIFCSTDGIFKSWNNDGDLYSFYNRWISNFCLLDTNDFNDWTKKFNLSDVILNDDINIRVKQIEEKLKDFFNNHEKNNLSGDDLSVAGFLKIKKEKIENYKKSKSYYQSALDLLNSKNQKEMEKAFSIFNSVINNEFYEAYIGLAKYYLLNVDLSDNESEKDKYKDLAIEALEKSINKGFDVNQSQLAKLFYEKGLKSKENKRFKEAFECFSKSYKINHNADSSYWLGRFYASPSEFDGSGVKFDKEKVWNYLKESADNGNANAQYSVAQCFKIGYVIPPNINKAKIYFEKAVKGQCDKIIEAKKELSNIQFDDAKNYYNKGDLDSAFPCFMAASVNGNLRSNYYLFELSLKKGDLDSAKNYLQKSQNINFSEEEFKPAKYSFAKSYAFRSPIDLGEVDLYKSEKVFNEIIDYKDSKKLLGQLQFLQYKKENCFEYLQKAVKNGYSEAEFELGKCYKEGKSVSIDLEKAVYYFKKAKDDGCSNNISLKEMLFELYISKNKVGYKEKSYNYLRESADAGYGKAQLEVGKFFVKGLPQQNFDKALEYLEKARIQGIDEANQYIPIVQYKLYEKYRYSNLEIAKRYLLDSYAAKNKDAMIELARCYADGIFSPIAKNLDSAERLYDELINQGHSELEKERNNVLHEKIIYAKEPNIAIKLFEKIGLMNFNEEDRRNYADKLCLNGIDLLKKNEFKSALDSFEKASNYGNAYADYWLSEFYSKPQNFGNVVNQDIREWNGFFDKAVKSQVWEAEYKYARYCVKGFQNIIQKDKDKADEFFQKSLSHYKNIPFSDFTISKKDIYRELGNIHKDSSDIGELKFARNQFEEAKKLGDSESLKLFADVDAKIKQIEEAKRKQQMGTPQTNVVQQNQFSMQSPNFNGQPASNNSQNYGTNVSHHVSSSSIKMVNQNTVKNSTFEEIVKILPDEKLKEIINLRSGGINHIDIKG